MVNFDPLEDLLYRYLETVRDFKEIEEVNSRLDSLLLKLRVLYATNGLFRTGQSITRENLLQWRRYQNGRWCGEKVVSYCRKEALDYARRLVELCRVLGLKPMRDEIEQLERTYFILSLFSSPSKQLKLAINVLFCHFWEETQERPETFVGAAGKECFPLSLFLHFARLKSKNNRRRRESLIHIYTLFQGLKKGLMPLRPHEVDASLLKHRKILNQDGATDDLWIEYRGGEFIGMKDRMLELVHESGISFNDRDPSNASRKSTAEYNYSTGGSLNLLLEMDRGATKWDPTEDYGNFYCNKPRRLLVPRISYFIGYVSREDWNVKPVYSGYSNKEEVLVGLKDVKQSWKEMMYKRSHILLNPDFKVENCAVPAVVLEPFKARIITKSSAGLYPLMTGIQKNTWRQLYEHKSGIFRLIGESLKMDHLYPILFNYKDGYKFVSGDYSGATDQLKQEISAIVIKGLTDNSNLEILNPVVADLIRTTLLSCTMQHCDSVLPEYEDFTERQGFKKIPCYEWEIREVEDLEQRNGQLMGHVLSFLVLCICNYLCLHLSYERYYGQKIKFGQIPKCLINGDDILFCAEENFIHTWETMLPSFGFVKSVGKNFVSDEFFQINSEMWIPQYRQVYQMNQVGPEFISGDYAELYSNTLERECYRAWKVPFVNFGLLTSRRKQDCTIDRTVQRVGLPSDMTDAGYDQTANHLLSLGSIYCDLIKGLNEEDGVWGPMHEIWESHQRGYAQLLKCKGYHGGYLPGIDLPESVYSLAVKNVIRSDCDSEVKVVAQLFPEFMESRLMELSKIRTAQLGRMFVRELERLRPGLSAVRLSRELRRA